MYVYKNKKSKVVSSITYFLGNIFQFRPSSSLTGRKGGGGCWESGPCSRRLPERDARASGAVLRFRCPGKRATRWLTAGRRDAGTVDDDDDDVNARAGPPPQISAAAARYRVTGKWPQCARLVPRYKHTRNSATDLQYVLRYVNFSPRLSIDRV